MPVVLPFRPSLVSYQFRSVLLGDEYRFRVHWNFRNSSFYFDVLDVTGSPIVIGVRAVLGVYFGRASTHRLFREGAMVARVPRGADRSEARFDDFGVRVQVWYFTTDEVVDEIFSALQRGQ